MFLVCTTYVYDAVPPESQNAKITTRAVNSFIESLLKT